MDELREKSKQNFNGGNTLESIQTGCIQRIADSLERMEKPYLDLIRKAEYLEKKNRELRSEIQLLENRNRSLKGWVTRLRNNINHGKINT
jgi:hypothetical protein